MQTHPFRIRFLVYTCLIPLFLGGGCAQTSSSSMSPYPIADSYPLPNHVVEVLPYPGAHQSSSTPVLPALPTPATPPGPPTIPVSWATYTHPNLPIQFRYPADWSGTAERYDGPDGFFEIRTIASPPSVFDQNSTFDKIGTLCLLEANGLNAEAYGAFPPIIDWREEQQSLGEREHSWFVEPFVHGCVVLATQSDTFQPGSQSTLFARFPPPWPVDKVLVLRSDAAHFKSFLSDLRLIGYTPPAKNESSPNSPACQEEPEGELVAISDFEGLVITETAIAKAGCDPWANYDGFQGRAEQANQSRKDFKQQGVLLQMEENNQALAPFGFHLEEVTHEHYSYTLLALYQGESVLVDYISRLEPVTINAAGNDFLLWLGVHCGEPPYVPAEVRRDGVRQDCSEHFGGLDSRQNSVWVGDQVLSYEIMQNWQQPLADRILAWRAMVKRGDEVIFELAVPQSGPILGARKFWSWEGHWLLEVNNVLVQDGELLNTQLGYDEIFEWHLVDKQPLYFFRAGFEYRLSYAGKTLPLRYEDIIHGEFWDDARSYSILSTIQGTDFFARRDGVWYHVTITSES